MIRKRLILGLKKKKDIKVSGYLVRLNFLEDLKSLTIEELEEQKVLTGEEDLTQDELNVLMDHEDEFARKGSFSRVFPLAANVDYYEKFFEVKRYFN